MLKARIAVLVSGGGTNLQALIDAQEAGKNPNGRIVLVVSSNSKAYALERARQHGIETAVLPRRKYATTEDYDQALLALMQEHEIDLIVLAGFMCILGSTFTRAYDRKIVNVHPSLIPSFCGDGFYGLHVHEAALAYGVKVTGATVHHAESRGSPSGRYPRNAAAPGDGAGRMGDPAPYRGDDLQRRDQVTQ
mgnify:CR=1 FL=1